MSTKDRLGGLLPHCVVTYGWHLAGPGPARYGWGAVTASGNRVYLGRCEELAEDFARKLGPLYGS